MSDSSGVPWRTSDCVLRSVYILKYREIKNQSGKEIFTNIHCFTKLILIFEPQLILYHKKQHCLTFPWVYFHLANEDQRGPTIDVLKISQECRSSYHYRSTYTTLLPPCTTYYQILLSTLFCTTILYLLILYIVSEKCGILYSMFCFVLYSEKK